jgi:hypothetical protein
MLNWIISFDIESNVMPLIHRKIILKYFENHKLKYIIKDMKNNKNKGLKKGLSLTFKRGTKQDYVTQKQ